MDNKWIEEKLKEGWPVITENKLLFIIIFAIGIIIGGGATCLYYNRSSDIQDSTIQAKDSTIQAKDSTIQLLETQIKISGTSTASIIKQEQAELRTIVTLGEITISSFEGKTIRLVDLVNEDNIIKKRTFEDCYIFGPAIMAPLGKTSIIDCSFAGQFDDLFITIQNRQFKGNEGYIGCLDCTFIRCNFSRIGIVGTSKLREKFLASYKQVN